MRILPVLDILGGQVVRGIAGRRAEYRPIVSRLTASCLPLDVAAAFREHFGLTELYLADLDAIARQPPALALYAELQAHGFRLWVDAGLQTLEQATLLADAGVAGLVVGLETVQGPEVLGAISARFGERTLFSLDLKGGRPLGNVALWGTAEPWAIAQRAVAVGVRRLLVLDLERVGMNEGTGTEDFCRQLALSYPALEIVAGGGVRSQEDLDRLERCGVHAVLVASALHDGRLTVSGRT